MRYAISEAKRKIVGRLEMGDLLPDALLKVCALHKISSAQVHALGAVNYLEVTEWDVQAGKYRDGLVRDGMAEIIMLYGNISYKEDEPFAHLHISASFHENGKTEMIAGHLVKAKVFACEYVIDALDDLVLTRTKDDETGLWLWDSVQKKGFRGPSI